MLIIYYEDMSRRYYRRRKSNSPTDELVFIGILVVVAILIQPGWQYSSTLVYTLVGLGTVVAIVAVAAVLKYRTEQRKIRALDIAAVDSMSGLDFEKYVAKILQHRGFSHVRLTEKYDFGVDIVARKDGITWGIQVKRYKQLVKVEAVRQVFTALVHYKCDRAMVITNSTYSRPARELAADNNCVLIDRDELAAWIVDFQENK